MKSRVWHKIVEMKKSQRKMDDLRGFLDLEEGKIPYFAEYHGCWRFNVRGEGQMSQMSQNRFVLVRILAIW